MTISFQHIVLMEFMYVPGIPELTKTFNMKSLEFDKGFLSSVWDNNVICSFSVKIFWTILMDFHILNYPCIPGMKSVCSLWMIFLMYSWIHFANILLSSFASPFIRGCFLSLLNLCVFWVSRWLWIYRKSLALFLMLYLLCNWLMANIGEGNMTC